MRRIRIWHRFKIFILRPQNIQKDRPTVSQRANISASLSERIGALISAKNFISTRHIIYCIIYVAKNSLDFFDSVHLTSDFFLPSPECLNLNFVTDEHTCCSCVRPPHAWFLSPWIVCLWFFVKLLLFIAAHRRSSIYFEACLHSALKKADGQLLSKLKSGQNYTKPSSFAGWLRATS